MRGPVDSFLKRALDLLVSGGLLLVFSPVLAWTWLMVRWKIGSPVLFSQIRPGLHARRFRLYKFRTMRDAVDASGQALPDAERLTPTGIWLRHYSLDELPQLFNVFRGDMSLVGPRPLLEQYLPRYSAEQARRHEVKPGVTGWAQVNGRNAISWEQKFSLDVWYVEHGSFRLDLWILALTFLKVLRRDGINQEGQATQSEFMGSPGPDRE
jgi:sugar transferase EpsL